jgi:hypothetical protein|tara:strand:+ start:23471 stop:24340 length:870 start_codon:yes stop_codon:yes gene_type:complete
MSYFKNTPESLLEKVKEIQIKTAAREGNKFTKALMAARENGNKFFTVNGKEYETEALDDKDVAIIKKVAGKLKGASQAHAGQSKDLEKALSDEVKYPHDMFDPKTGKKEVAKNVDDHNRLSKMGYTHDDPKKKEDPSHSVVIKSQKKKMKEDNTNDKSDDGEGMDKVQPKALKKKFKDRKDKDIDNDGDVDDSDRYLHRRRKAVSKAIKKEESISDIQGNKNLSMREALAKIWKTDAGKSYFEGFASDAQRRAAFAQGYKAKGKDKKEQVKEKTLTGKKETKVEINPKV